MSNPRKTEKLFQFQMFRHFKGSSLTLFLPTQSANKAFKPTQFIARANVE